MEKSDLLKLIIFDIRREDIPSREEIEKMTVQGKEELFVQQQQILSVFRKKALAKLCVLQERLEILSELALKQEKLKENEDPLQNIEMNEREYNFCLPDYNISEKLDVISKQIDMTTKRKNKQSQLKNLRFKCANTDPIE